jgi:hypothetical protein
MGFNPTIKQHTWGKIHMNYNLHKSYENHMNQRGYNNLLCIFWLSCFLSPLHTFVTFRHMHELFGS